MENYLKILEESLIKKIKVLESIEEVSRAQAELLGDNAFDMERFDRCVDEKDAMIAALIQLDDGFEALYNRVREQLMQDKSKYVDQINNLQELIGSITEKNVSIQAQEGRNKAAIERYFSAQRKEIGQGRKSSKAAYSYYQNKAGVVNSYFMDTKK